MLNLPKQWRQCGVSYLVTELLIQAEHASQYPYAARAFAGTAIDFMLSGPRWKHRRAQLTPAPVGIGWQLNNTIIHLPVATNDDALREIRELPTAKFKVQVLAPPWSRCLFEHAIHDIDQKRSIEVVGIDSFCDLHLLWTGLEMEQPHAVCVANFIDHYRRMLQNNHAIMTPDLSAGSD